MHRITLLRRLAAASVAAAALGPGSAFAITVVAETPLEMEKTVPQTVISKEMILQLPTSRDVGEILTMTPGLPGPGPVESVPGVETIRYRLDGSSSAPAFPPGTTVDFGDGKALHFPSMYTFRFNAPTDGMRIVVRRPDRKKPLVDEPVRIPAVQLRDFGTIVAPNRFETPPVAVAGRISVVRGSLSGDGAKTKLTIGGKPVRIVAENPRAVFFEVPDGTPAGYAKLAIDDGGRTAEIPVAILTLSMSADQLKLKRGQTTKFHVTISGPESWDDAAWKSAIPWDLCDVDALRAKFRSFQTPEPGSDGFLLFSVTNMSPGVISMQEFARRLGKADFKSGSFSYDGGIGAVNDGGFGIHGEVEAFVAPASAEISEGK